MANFIVGRMPWSNLRQFSAFKSLSLILKIIVQLWKLNANLEECIMSDTFLTKPIFCLITPLNVWWATIVDTVDSINLIRNYVISETRFSASGFLFMRLFAIDGLKRTRISKNFTLTSSIWQCFTTDLLWLKHISMIQNKCLNRQNTKKYFLVYSKKNWSEKLQHTTRTPNHTAYLHKWKSKYS